MDIKAEHNIYTGLRMYYAHKKPENNCKAIVCMCVCARGGAFIKLMYH